MMRGIGRLFALGLLALLGAVSPVPGGAEAEARGIHREFREGMREIARERREMRRDIMNSGSRREAERAYRKGMREIGRERREMRREIRREVRRRHAGRVVAGIVLGSILRAPAQGRPPARPGRDLCWYWTDEWRSRGYWYHCTGD